MDRIDGDILVNGTAYVYGLASKTTSPLLRSRDVNQFHVAKYFHSSSGGPDTAWIHSVRGASGLVK